MKHYLYPARNNGFPLQIIHNLKNRLIKTKNKKNSHTNTKNEMGYIYVSQSTHTQSYIPLQKYRRKHTFSNL